MIVRILKNDGGRLKKIRPMWNDNKVLTKGINKTNLLD